MKKRKTLDASMQSASFARFLCFTLGFLLLEACTLHAGSNLLTRQPGTFIGITISVLIWHCVAPFWTIAPADTSAAGQAHDRKPVHATDVVSGALLAGIGYLGAGALLSGWATPVSAFASCVFLFPWSRMPLCRRGLVVPCAVLALGAAIHLYWAVRMPPLISTLIAAWMLWATALCCWLRLILLRQEKLTMAQPANPEAAERTEDAVQH